MDRFTSILAALFLVSVTSCMTTHSNHGTSVGQDKTAVGAEVNLLFAAANPDTTYTTVRGNLVHGFSDTFDAGVSLGHTMIGTTSYNSVGGRVLWALPNETGTLAFDLAVDYYFGLTSGDSEVDDDIGISRYSGVQPAGSVAYSFLNGNLRPFVGLSLTPGYLTGYGGIELKLGPVKPSLLAGVLRPTVSSGDSEIPLIYIFEPGLALEF